mgnify:CR=1 FL=1
MSTQERIKEQVENNNVVLYMKGTPAMPQCGFCSLAVQVLELSGVKDFFTFNVLEDMDIRQGIKDVNNWPTIPQVFVKGEFIGGCDILREMFETGELRDLMIDKGIELQTA